MRLSVLLLCAAALGGCSVDMGGFAFTSDTREGRSGPVTTTTTSSLTASASTLEATLTPDGECSAGTSARPLPPAITEGITECELVKLKGTRPTDVLIGDSGKGQREVQVLYSEPGGREIYMFTDNRLSRIVKPGQG
ncbi:MAG: hypothetical protein Q8R85_07475 [Bosea sp. (in: a-proteobacteria)]|uniref:hypothetical protein n=1 Tax=Bosea sp. (in: a-proteobacteria) TaxID=1871050 RepID=UPI000AEE1EF2|nr:hypothetical protein [Bosea sp. (in: a-proteobacteria)]MCZ8042857.1 hypothetical protein [Beijerinckiaceae bacterium]MDP3600983.1 hypothetical protein [Bosea sp. (in: a-proteobacteria)]